LLQSELESKISRILNFWIFPETVMGKSLVTLR
jgi:hypothetical protein